MIITLNLCYNISIALYHVLGIKVLLLPNCCLIFLIVFIYLYIIPLITLFPILPVDYRKTQREAKTTVPISKETIFF